MSNDYIMISQEIAREVHSIRGLVDSLAQRLAYPEQKLLVAMELGDIKAALGVLSNIVDEEFNTDLVVRIVAE